MSDRLAGDVVAWRELTDPSSIIPANAPVSLVRIVRTALTAVQEHLSHDRMTEHIGLLFGQVELAVDTSLVVTILIAHPLDAAFASSTHVVMQRDEWPSAWRRLSSCGFDQQQLVGWYHSHPGHSIFLSTTDLQTHALWFRQPGMSHSCSTPSRSISEPSAVRRGGEHRCSLSMGHKIIQWL